MEKTIRILKQKIFILFNSLGYLELLFYIRNIKETSLNSYTLNKELVFINNKQKNIRVLYYILLHEISHILCANEIGHTKHFFKIFNFLVNKSIELKLIRIDN